MHLRGNILPLRADIVGQSHRCFNCTVFPESLTMPYSLPTVLGISAITSFLLFGAYMLLWKLCASRGSHNSYLLWSIAYLLWFIERGLAEAVT